MKSSIAGNWKHLKSEKGEDLKLFKFRFDWVENLRNGLQSRMVVLESADSANVIALTPERELLMARQYRFGTREVTLELPGGVVDPGEDSLAAARRELLEETGYASDDWHYLGTVPSNPVFMDNYCHHWLALKVFRAGAPQFDPGEFVELEKLPESQVPEAVRSGQVSHPHSLSALARVYDLRTFPAKSS